MAPRYVSVGGAGKTIHLIPRSEVNTHDHNYDCTCEPAAETGWDGRPFAVHHERES